jgi:hypothetical protein
MKADLHVHSYHSGYNHDLPFLRSRDCYTDPAAVYRTAKARGMDLVTITDHDSIDGCLEFLDRHPDTPDFIIGEEISCWIPAAPEAPVPVQRPIEVHLGAYGMTERAHREIQPLRKNAFEAMAYLRQAGIFFSVNHLFHFYKGQMPLARYLALLLDNSPALETRNGAMLPAHNALIETVREKWDTGLARAVGAEAWPAGAGMAQGERSAVAAAGSRRDARSAPRARHAIVAGSDAHTLRRVGRTWTSVPASSREEFLANLAAGMGRAEGQQGGAVPLAADIYGVIADYWLCLVGLQRHEISLPRRAFGLGFSIVSAPFEFIPFIIAALTKRGEARRVREAADWIARAAAAPGPRAGQDEIAAARHDAGVAGAVATPSRRPMANSGDSRGPAADACATPSTDGTRAAVPAALPSARPDRPVDVATNVADVSAAAPSEAVSEAAVHG